MPHFARELPRESPYLREMGEAHVNRELAASSEGRQSCWTDRVVVVRGEDRDALLRRVQTLRESVEQANGASLQDLAGELNARVIDGGVRLAVVASSRQELTSLWMRAEQQLADPAVQEINDASGIYFAAEPLGPQSKIGFLFPGEGAPYLDMLGDLAREFPEVQYCLERSDQGAVERGWKPFSRFFCLAEDLSDDERNALQAELEELGNTMLCCMIGSWALYELLSNLGIRAHAVAGHSAGELSALCAAGCLDPMHHMLPMADALREVNGDDAPPSILLAAAAPRRAIVEALTKALHDRGWQDEAFLAMDNCPHQVIVAGTTRAMKALEEELRTRRVLFERLPFDRPYHTPLFERMVRPLSAALASVTVDPPHTTIYSCSTAQPFPREPEAICEVAVRQWVTPVEFAQLIRRMHDDGMRILLEVGPRGNLTSFVEDILRGERFLASPVNVVRRSGTSQLNHLVGRLAAHGVPVNFHHLHRRRDVSASSGEGAAAHILRPVASDDCLASPSDACLSSSRSSKSQPMPAPEQNGHALPQRDRPSAPMNSLAIAQGVSLEDVVSRYQDAMDAFLEVQRDVMKQFLEVLSGDTVPDAGDSFSHPMAAVGTENQLLHVGKHEAPSYAGEEIDGAKDDETEFDGRFECAVDPNGSALPGASVASERLAPMGPSPEELLRMMPLIGEVIDYQPGQKLVARRTLDLQEDWFGAQHTVGGRRVSKIDPNQNGLPIMPMTFSLEMMAEAATVLAPDCVVLGLDRMALIQGLVFDEDQPPVIEVEARRLDAPPTNDEGITIRIRAEIYKLEPDTLARPQSPVVYATVLLGESYPPSPPLRPWDAATVHASPITLEQMYKNLFHGEAFQGVIEIVDAGENNIEAKCVVLANDKLFRSNPAPRFVIDPVFLDVVMHPLAGWHLEQPNQAGRIMLPYELETIRFYRPSPPPGEVLTSRGVIDYESVRRFIHAIEAFDDNGQLWCRMRAKYWRFYLPFGEYNFHGPKDTYFLSRDWLELLPARLTSKPSPQAWGMRLEPSQDMMQPAMRLATAQVTLTREEFRAFRARPDAEQSPWLFSRVAVKDAVRSLWRETRGDNLFAADIEIDHDGQQRLHARLRGTSDTGEFPSIDCDYRDGWAVGVATWLSRVGVALRPIGETEAPLPTADAPRCVRLGPEPGVALARLDAARAAVARAMQGPGCELGVEILSFDSETETLTVRLDEAAATRFPDVGCAPLTVYTRKDGELIAAVTFCEPIAPTEAIASAPVDREQILADVIASLRNLRGRQYSHEIGPESLFFGNLGYVSIDVIVLWETLENRYGRRFPYQELLDRVRLRANPDLRIGELVEFLCQHLNQPENSN